MKSLLITILSSVLLLLNGISLVDSQIPCNNDGTIDSEEECDNGGDLSDTTCINCSLAVQLDLNLLVTPVEYFDLDTVVYFTEPSRLLLTLSRFRNLSRIILVMLQDNPPIDDQINIFPSEAFSAERLTQDYSPFFTNSFLAPNDPRLSDFNINASLVTQGRIITGNSDSIFFGGDGDNELTQEEAEIALLSAGYIAREHPGFNLREFCIIIDDSVTSSISCQSLNFIGKNDDPPVVTYDMESVASFTEGETEFVPIINGTISISDPDHPRFLQMAATATIVDYVSGDEEVLSVTLTSYHSDFTLDYNSLTGVLNINGSGSPELYVLLLTSLSYLNNMTEPSGTSREIEIAIFDGVFWSIPATVLVDIINVNDLPAISLDGANPVITVLSANYTEGSGSVPIVPNLVILDVDPNPMILRVSVRIMNPLDGTQERLGYSGADNMGLTVTLTPHEVIFTGVYPLSVYNNVVRGVTYEHLDAAPGNPSTDEIRAIEFEVEDDNGASNLQNSILMLTIVPVNDAPILFFVYATSSQDDSSLFSGSGDSPPEPLVVNGNTTAIFIYREDDAAVNFGSDIYLRDVDSNIESATLWLTNLLNGENDNVYVSNVLLDMHNVTMTIEEEALEMSRVIRLYGEATPAAYEEILQSLTYRNLHQDNQVMDGQRTIIIYVNDTADLASPQISATIDVADRNDALVVDLGGGGNADLNITFTENGASVPIVLPHLVSIMDEEGHNISRLTAELIPASTDMNLDPSDAIFLRSPLALQFINNFLTPPTTTFIDIGLNATTATYIEALLSIYYDNAEDEPTLFRREIIITLYDNNFLRNGTTNDPDSIFDDELGVSRTVVRVGITVVPINDNAPRILIRAQPDGCGMSSVFGGPGEESSMRRRRDVKAAASKLRKRSVEYKMDESKSPGITAISAHIATSQCLRTINITFNTETNTPIVEISSKLKNIISFDDSALNSAHKFGIWLDRSTLLIVFSECLEWTKIGLNGRERPVFVFFEGERGDCSWEGPCNEDNTICFHNNTGCPVSGPYQIDMNSGPCHEGMDCGSERDDDGDAGSGDVGSTEDVGYMERRNGLIFYVLLMVVITTVFLSFVYLCGKIAKRTRTLQETSPKVQMKSTSIQMTSDPIIMTSDPTTKELTHQNTVGVQEVAVTISPLPPYEEKVGVVRGVDKQSPHGHRERRRRKRKNVTRDEAEMKCDDEAPLLNQEGSSSEGDDAHHGGMVTLSPERSCDASSSLGGGVSAQLTSGHSKEKSRLFSSPTKTTEQSLSLHLENTTGGNASTSTSEGARKNSAPSCSTRGEESSELIAAH